MTQLFCGSTALSPIPVGSVILSAAKDLLSARSSTKAAGTLLTVICLGSSAAAQNPPPTCPTPPHVQTIRSMRDLPATPREALQTKVKDIVDSDQPFDATDVVMNGAHFNRFAFAWQTRDRFLIATEHGGIAYWNAIYVATAQPAVAHAGPVGAGPVQIVEAAHAQPNTLCSTMRHALPNLQPSTPAELAKHSR